MTTTYRRHYKTEGMSLIIAANFAEASSPICAIWVEAGESPADDDERWFSTPYQVADARHRPAEAFRLVREWR